MTKSLPDLCYLCGTKLTKPISYDHVPMRQLWARELRRDLAPQLLTIPAHKSCNSIYQQDEDYFIQSIVPFVPQSYAGNALFRKIVAEYRSGQNCPLVHKVLGEFERSPSGLKLPPNKIVKRFDGERISRIAWKIVRGLNFHHTDQVLPADWTKSVEFHLADESWVPPDHFKEFISLPNNSPHGAYEGVFSYRFRSFPEVNNLHYWALLILDRIIVIVIFHDLACTCINCTPHSGTNYAVSEKVDAPTILQ